MSDKGKKQIFGSKDLTIHLNDYLLSQASILKEVSKSKQLIDRADEIRVVLMSSVGIAVAIARLVKENMLNESTMLTRALLERLINFAYLMVCDEDEYKKYKAYSLQKSYRKLDRNITGGKHSFSIQYQGIIDIESIPDLKNAISQFTGSKGGEKTRWTNIDISERVAVVDERSKINAKKWLLSLLSFFEDASEALHGTFYGATFHLGIHEYNFNKDDKQAIEINAQKKLTLLCWQMGDLLADVIELIDEKYSISELAENSKENSEKTFEIMKFILED